MKYLNRMISWILILAMVAGMVPGAVFATEEYPQILLDQQITLTAEGNGEAEMFRFVPEESGIYRFYSFDSKIDPRGYILDSDMRELAYNDDGGENANFRMEVAMEAGQVYYLKAEPYDPQATGIYWVSVIKLVKATALDIRQESVFDHAGESATLSVSFSPENGAAEEITWTSADPTIATVHDGYVELLSAGTTVITATTESGLTDSVTVTVRDVPYVTAGQTVTLPTAEGYHNAVVKFVPEQTGVYRFYSFNSTDGADPYGFMKDVHLSEFAYDSGKDKDFCIECNLNAGETYYLFAENSGTYSAPYSVAIVPLVPATALAITQEDISGRVGDRQELTVTFSPDNGIVEAVTWVSDNTDIVKVDEYGVISMQATGSATVTATSENGLTDSVKVTVEDVPVITLGQQITLDTEVDGGEGSFRFIPERSGFYRFYSLGDDVDTKGEILDSQLQQVAEDDDGGPDSNFCVDATLEAGQVYYMKCSPYDGNESGTYQVSVMQPVQATAVNIEEEEFTFYVGDRYTFAVTFNPEDAMGGALTWTSNNPDVARVDSETGYAEMLSPGTTTITVTTERGLTDSATVTVREIPAIAADQEVILSAQEQNGTATFKFVPEEDGVYRFYSYNNEMDTVGAVLDAHMHQFASDDDSGEDNNFRIDCQMYAGETYYLQARPYASNRAGTYSIKIVLTVQATSVEINPSAISGYPGDQYVLTTTFYPENAREEYVSWASDDPAVVTVESNGDVTLVAPGTATITATTGLGLTATIAVTVNSYPALQLGVPSGATIEKQGQAAWFTFTPEKDGYYAFYSLGNCDPYAVLLNADGDSLADNDDSQSGLNFKLKHHLKAGEEYRLQVRCYGSGTGSFDVCVEESRYITKLELTGMPDCVEYVEGYRENVSFKGLQLQATWSDGEVTDWMCLQDYFYVEYIGDERLTAEFSDEDKVILSCGGQTASYNLRWIDTPVDHLELVSGTSRTYLEHVDGYYMGEEGTFIYETYDHSDAVIRIVYKDGTSVTANVRDRVGRYYVEWEHDQESTPWVVGTENASTVSYLDHTVNLPITVEECTVAGLELVSGSIRCMENENGYFMDETFQYEYALPEDMTVKITYTDGTSKIVNVNDNVDGYRFYTNDNQYDDPWQIGEDNYLILAYQNAEVRVPVTILPSPLERLELISAPTREYIYGDSRYGESYSSEYMLYPTDLTGLSFKAYYTDGTSRTFSHKDLQPNEEGWGGILGGYNYELVYESWEIEPGEQEVIFSYLGQRMRYNVTVKESNVSSVAVTKLPAKTVYSGYYNPNFVGMEILITYDDGATKTVKVTEQNSRFVLDRIYGPRCKVQVGDSELTIHSNNDLGSYTVNYMGQSYTGTDLRVVNTRYVKDVQVRKATVDGKGMVVDVTYSDGETRTLTLNDVVSVKADEGDTYDYHVGYAKTEDGYLYYIVETQLTPEGKTECYIVEIFNIASRVWPPAYLAGDMNDDGAVTDADAMYLLRHTLFGSGRYPINQSGDVNGDGAVTDADAMYLLRHTLFGPGRYPLH